MEFLCPTHRKQFSELPLEERKDLWQFWMENAYASCEQGQWRDVISLAGSAFDLACLPGENEKLCMHVELTLAAILVSRVLADMGDRTGTERVIFQALASLQAAESSCAREQPVLEQCISALLDGSHQHGFFEHYLNWPSLPAARGGWACVRVLH
ncbi:hypothetical protein [Marinobacter salicampi]|uniref:hypothetical protein n=1 Tax=Marinobacter salicampi TaxID=435907 RepID=UPI00140B625F|nr:hypothetical protein [Marinobacter salicampi]